MLAQGKRQKWYSAYDCAADLARVFLPRLRISSCQTFPEEMGWQKRDIQHIKKSKVRDPLQNSERPTWWPDLPFGCQSSWLGSCSRSTPLHYTNPGSCLPQHSLRRAGPKGKGQENISHWGSRSVAWIWGQAGHHWEYVISFPSGGLLYSQCSLWK